MREEEERRARELEEESEMLTFSREDAINQVSTKSKKLQRGGESGSGSGKKTSRKFVISNKTTTISGTNGKSNIRPVNHYHPNRPKGMGYRTRVMKRLKIKKALNKEEKEEEPEKPIEEAIKSVESPEKEDLKEESNKVEDSCEIKENDDIDNSEESESSMESTYSTEANKISSNHIDHNSPRTRSRGTVAINLWTLDVSPILPGVKPVKSSSSSTPLQHKKRDKVDGNELEKPVKKIKVEMEVDKSDTKLLFKGKRKPKSKIEEEVIVRKLRKKNGNKDLELQIKVEKITKKSVDGSHINNSDESKLDKGKGNVENIKKGEVKNDDCNVKLSNITTKEEKSSKNLELEAEKEKATAKTAKSTIELDINKEFCLSQHNKTLKVVLRDMDKDNTKEYLLLKGQSSNLTNLNCTNVDASKPKKMFDLNSLKSPESKISPKRIRKYNKKGADGKNTSLDSWVTRSPKHDILKDTDNNSINNSSVIEANDVECKNISSESNKRTDS